MPWCRASPPQVLVTLLAACPGPAPTAVPGNVAVVRPTPRPRWPSFLAAHHHGGGTRPCTADDYARGRAAAGSPPRARAEAWAAIADTCWMAWHDDDRHIDPAGLDAHVAFATSLLEAGFPSDCAALLTAVTSPYPGGLSDLDVAEDQAPQVDAALALGARCAAAAGTELAMFAAPTCPSDDACFALVDGTPPAPVDPAVAGPTAVTCPVVERRTATGTRRLVADDGALVGGFCCGVATVATAVVDGERYLLVRPDARESSYVHDCLGGTTVLTPISIYRVDGDRLELAADRSLVWH